MKFKTHKAARNYLVTRVEMAGINVKDINLDQLITEMFISRGRGTNFELELVPRQDTLLAILRALRIPRRGTVSDEHWTAAVKRLAAYTGMYYIAEDADALATELGEQALFAQFMMEEAL